MFELIFKLDLIILAIDHFITAFIGIFLTKSANTFFNKIFSINIPNDERFTLLYKPWGALGIFAGIVGLFPLFDLERYFPILYALLILLIIRIGIRISFSRKITRAFNMSWNGHYFHITKIAVSAAIIGIKTLQT